MSSLLLLLLKPSFIFPAMIFIITNGILYAKKFEENHFLKGIIGFVAILSTYFLADQVYGEYKKYNKSDSSSVINEVITKNWDKRIYQGKRSYSINTEHTVKDNYTGLVWQKEDDGTKRTWEEANEYCKTLPLSKRTWSLPSIKELNYLTDVTQVNKPAFNAEYFNLKEYYYWTKTKKENKADNYWVVYFKYGYDYWDSKGSKDYVLCVSRQ